MHALTVVRDVEDGPSEAELAVIDAEMPVVTAEVELLDVEISLLDQPATPWNTQRLRHAHRELLAARLAVAFAHVAGVVA